MRWLIAAVAVACFGVASADEMDNANRDIRTLTGDAARRWNENSIRWGGARPLISELAPQYRDQYSGAVVHAEAVEPLAFSALSRKQHVVYRNLKTLSPEHLKYLDKRTYRPSLPSIESMTPELAKKLSICNEKPVDGLSEMPLHLCGLKSLDTVSLGLLKNMPLCLCGLESLSIDNARELAAREEGKAGILLSNKTNVPDDAWRVIEEPVAKTLRQRKIDTAITFGTLYGLRIIDGPCRHTEVLFATERELAANQPPPQKPQPVSNPFNR
jgi:hypothetical protein